MLLSPPPRPTLTRTTAPLLASVCSGEPSTSALGTEPPSNLSLSPSFPAEARLSNCPACLSSLFFRLSKWVSFFFRFSSSAHFVPLFLVQFSICVLLCGSFYCITLFPVRSIYPCMAKSFPSVRVCYGVFSFSTSVFRAVTHQPFIFSTEPSSASANFLPPNSFQIQLNLERLN